MDLATVDDYNVSELPCYCFLNIAVYVNESNCSVTVILTVHRI